MSNNQLIIVADDADEDDDDDNDDDVPLFGQILSLTALSMSSKLSSCNCGNLVVVVDGIMANDVCSSPLPSN